MGVVAGCLGILTPRTNSGAGSRPLPSYPLFPLGEGWGEGPKASPSPGDGSAEADTIPPVNGPDDANLLVGAEVALVRLACLRTNGSALDHSE